MFVVYGKSTEASYGVLKKASEIQLHRARTHGVTFAPKKYELLHLTRSPKRCNKKATVDLVEVVVKLDTSICSLGLQIDGRLKWGPHLATVKTKMESQKRELTIVVGASWGTMLQKAQKAYGAVEKPLMTYAAVH